MIFGYTGASPENFMSKYTQEVFDDEKLIFGQTIWLLHSFLRNLNTKRLISPEWEGFREAQILSGLYWGYIYI